ncbi:MAG: RNA polymerase sigma factor [Bacteroidales bacterium]|jgi:RNA polymerase sigma-70 factor (ECF subfamily)
MKEADILYNRYSKKIYNLAYRMTGNREDANDITQETFIRAFKSLDRFKGESHIYTWLYKIARNNCFRFLEKKKKTTFLSLQELIDKTSSPVSGEIPETEKRHYIKQVKDGCLSGLLRCLSLQQRLAFILHVLLEVPLEQVAGIVEKSENATRILVHRAKRNIRDFLCNNCSLYDPENTCHCENMIDFSLKQNWIGKDDMMVPVEQIESEIRTLKSVVGLYKTLEDITPANGLDKHIQRLLTDKENFSIFHDKKVK